MSTTRTLRLFRAAAVLAVCLLAGSLGAPAADPDEKGAASAEGEDAYRPERIESEALPNALRLHEKVISGGLPDGDEGFRQLAALKVRTIISVDGAPPDLEGARRHGLTYVHLPHGYDGINHQRAVDLAKAVRDLPGPIYIHCHHGKHRSPAAAAVGCVGAGLLPPKAARAVLGAAGTSRDYRGLFAAAEGARPLDKEFLDEQSGEFPETAKLPPMAEAMVEIEHLFSSIEQAERRDWAPPADELSGPAHHGLLLKEQYMELQRTEEVNRRPEKFRELLAQARAQAQAFEDACQKLKSTKDPKASRAEMSKRFAAVKANCRTCHREFRDQPREEAKP